MKTQTAETLAALTPNAAKELLVKGNIRFVENLRANRDFQSQVKATSSGQYPFAVILSCIDSRVPAETVFDQGIGDLFSVRVAGNIVNEDVLGSMEYACGVVGSKIAVVMGHTKCGAVNAACQNVQMGNITALLDKIQPAVNKVKAGSADLTEDQVETVGRENVAIAIEQIRERSSILSNLEKEGKIQIVGAVYSVTTGEVEFI